MEIKAILRNEKAFKELVKETFDEFNLNQNGELDKNGFAYALREYSKSIGFPVISDGIINATMKELSNDNSNTVSLERFESLMRTVMIQMIS